MNNLHNIKLEQALLSSFMYDQSLIQSCMLQADDFYFIKHQQIFNVIYSLHKQNIPIEDMFVNNELKKMGFDAESEFVDILATAPLANFKPYAQQLLELKNKRELHSLIHKMQSDIDSATNTHETLNIFIGEIEQFKISNKIELFEKHDITTIEPAPSEFILQHWLPIPKNTVSLITAQGGIGKSWLSLQLIMRFLQKNQHAKAFAWLSEDPTNLTAYRAKSIAEKILLTTLESFKDRLFFTNSPTFQVLQENNRKIQINSQFNEFKRLLSGYELIVLDPLIAFFGGDENNNSHARRFMQLFTEWAAKENKCIVFIHHSPKNTSQSRGASAFVDAVRLVYEVSMLPSQNKQNASEDEIKRQITLTKDNYGVAQFLRGKTVLRQIFPTKEIVPSQLPEDF